jgi:hypothetical protein
VTSRARPERHAPWSITSSARTLRGQSLSKRFSARLKRPASFSLKRRTGDRARGCARDSAPCKRKRSGGRDMADHAPPMPSDFRPSPHPFQSAPITTRYDGTHALITRPPSRSRPNPLPKPQPPREASQTRSATPQNPKRKPRAASDQTTQSPFVKSAVSAPVEVTAPAPTPCPATHQHPKQVLRLNKSRRQVVHFFLITQIVYQIVRRAARQREFQRWEQYIKHISGVRIRGRARSLRNKMRRCSLTLCARTWRATMEIERDVWNATYFHRAIRKRIGEALSAGYDLSRPLPDRIHTLLGQLDEPSAGGATDAGKPLPPTSSR